MTTGKIERPATAARAKVERTQVETPTKPAAVSRTGLPQRTAFSDNGPSQLDVGRPGTHVARSAGPDALWGSAPSEPQGPDMDPHQFDELTPAQRTEKLKELRATRDGLQVKILERVIALDKKWNSAPTATKKEALEQYADNSEQLDPAAAQELKQMLRQAQVAQRRIDRLRSRRDGMPPARNANAEVKRQRAELNKELRAARNEQKAAVKEATAVVDEQGLKIDRLAVTEQVIDPNAPKPTADTSLLGMVTNFFKFSWLSDLVMRTIADYKDHSSEKHVHEAAMQRAAADDRAHTLKVGHREALAKLTAAADLAQR